MKIQAKTVFLLIVCLILAGRAYSQFTAAEVAEWPKWEEFLKTAEIVKGEEIGEGVTKPLRLTLRKNGLEARGVWKNPSGIQGGFLEGWQYEIAAYEMDKLLGLGMIPPTVEREFRGKKGSLQLWVTVKHSLLKIMEEQIPIPEESRESLDRMKYIVRAYDSLIANDDRTQQNLLYTEDWRTIVIDHSRSFRSSREHVKKLMYGRNGIKNADDGRPHLFRRLPRTMAEAIRGLDRPKLEKALGSLLTKAEIEAVLARRQLLLDEISFMIKEQGEANVLY
ncbi:MAG: hypothetical protein A2Y86_02200 [Candidatus Aminicenantes bacterium RBG_13_62_12]|nr:MAG: hypothetical protein A2Y86_02200 [Candidatus Aminicenantes bacterium RBG_13_62_12]